MLCSSSCDENIRRISFDNDPRHATFTLRVQPGQLLTDHSFAVSFSNPVYTDVFNEQTALPRVVISSTETAVIKRTNDKAKSR